MTSNQEFFKIYPWITSSFFEQILRKNKQIDNLVINDFIIKAALGKGENYSSQMIRANVDYSFVTKNNKEKHETISLIIKAELIVNEVSAESGMFYKEIQIYDKILPKIHMLLESIGDPTRLSAKCYAVDCNPCYLVFEDLSLLGYKLANRRIGLEVDHYRHLFRKLARWHAVTAVIGTKDISYMKLFMEPHITEKSNAFLSILNNCLSSTAEVCADWPGCEQISKKLYALQDTFRKKVCDEFSRNDDDFNVLTHGDLWINNCMFKSSTSSSSKSTADDNNGKVEDIYFVDYSTGFWGSPGFDISYTLFTSCSLNCQEMEWDYLIQLYHSELTRILQDLKYPKRLPTLTDIHLDILRTGVYPAILSSLVLGLRSVEDPEKVGIPFFVEDTPEFREIRINMLNAPKCRAGLEYLMDYCNRKGLLD